MCRSGVCVCVCIFVDEYTGVCCVDESVYVV